MMLEGLVRFVEVVACIRYCKSKNVAFRAISKFIFILHHKEWVEQMSTSPPPSKRQKLGFDEFVFPIDPLARFAGPCATVKEPVEVSCFSYNKQRKLLHDASSMVFAKRPI